MKKIHNDVNIYDVEVLDKKLITYMHVNDIQERIQDLKKGGHWGFGSLLQLFWHV